MDYNIKVKQTANDIPDDKVAGTAFWVLFTNFFTFATVSADGALNGMHDLSSSRISFRDNDRPVPSYLTKTNNVTQITNHQNPAV